MVDCRQCIRCKAKPQDIEQLAGMVECKVSGDAGEVLAAFNQFAAVGEVRSPFKVVGVAGQSAYAWPLQYHPEAIAFCDGFLKIES